MQTQPKVVQLARFSEAERPHVDRIVERAVLLFREAGMPRDRNDIEMDLAAVHHHTPLRLEELAVAEEWEFVHDIAGITRHLNRRTGELENAFLPRFTRPATVAEVSHA